MHVRPEVDISMLANDRLHIITQVRSLAWLCSSDLSNDMKMDINDLGSTADTSDLKASVFAELCELRLHHLVPGGGYHRWRGHTTDACPCSVSLPRTNYSLIAPPNPGVFSPGVGLPYISIAQSISSSHVRRQVPEVARPPVLLSKPTDCTCLRTRQSIALGMTKSPAIKKNRVIRRPIVTSSARAASRCPRQPPPPSPEGAAAST